jgi:hypothetical protein
MSASDQITCLDLYFASFEESLASKNDKPWIRRQRRWRNALCLRQSADAPNQAGVILEGMWRD